MSVVPGHLLPIIWELLVWYHRTGMTTAVTAIFVVWAYGYYGFPRFHQISRPYSHFRLSAVEAAKRKQPENRYLRFPPFYVPLFQPRRYAITDHRITFEDVCHNMLSPDTIVGGLILSSMVHQQSLALEEALLAHAKAKVDAFPLAILEKKCSFVGYTWHKVSTLHQRDVT